MFSKKNFSKPHPLQACAHSSIRQLLLITVSRAAFYNELYSCKTNMTKIHWFSMLYYKYTYGFLFTPNLTLLKHKATLIELYTQAAQIHK